MSEKNVPPAVGIAPGVTREGWPTQRQAFRAMSAEEAQAEAKRRNGAAAQERARKQREAAEQDRQDAEMGRQARAPVRRPAADTYAARPGSAAWWRQRAARPAKAKAAPAPAPAANASRPVIDTAAVYAERNRPQAERKTEPPKAAAARPRSFGAIARECYAGGEAAGAGVISTSTRGGAQ